MEQMYNVSSNPHVRARMTTAKIMQLVVIALLPAALMGIYNHGLKALAVLVVSTGSAVLAEWLYDHFMHKKNTAPMFDGLIDIVSISLNTPNKERYLELTRSKFGIESFDAMIKFAENVKHYVKEVVLSTVSTTLTEEEEKECADICKKIGVTYRIRPFED